MSMWRAMYAQATGPLAPIPPGPAVPAAAPSVETTGPGILPWLVALLLVVGILFLVCMPSRKTQ
ncbi:MAG: hypothetical protein SNJ82_05460 [Gemmataceae bacterium]